jgi:Ca-activated chloride channel homolog
VVVVDKSGSMALDQRLEKVKDGLRLLVDGLQPTDRLAIVAFDSTAQVALPFSGVESKSQMLRAINALEPGTATNIYDGLDLGFAQFGVGSFNERQNRLLLLSDGQATAGNTDPQSMISLAESKVATGIGLSTVGVGNTFDAPLMRGLAERGAGNFYFAQDAVAVKEVFTEELKYFIEPLALDVTLAFQGDSRFQIGEVLGNNYWRNYGFAGNSDAGSVTLPAVFVSSRTGDAGQGKRGGGGAILIHLIENLAATQSNTDNIGTVRLNYRLPNSQNVASQELVVARPAPLNPDAVQTYVSDPKMNDVIPMYNVFRVLRWAASNIGTPNCGSKLLKSTRTQLADWLAVHPNQDGAGDLMLIDMFIANLADRVTTDETSCSYVENIDRECSSNSMYCQSSSEEFPEARCGFACSASSTPAGVLTMMGVMIALAGRRRNSRW